MVYKKNEDVLMQAEPNGKLALTMIILSGIIICIGMILLFSALLQNPKTYLTSYQEAKRNQDIIISLIIIVCGWLELYQSSMWGSTLICICKDKVYISKGIKQSDKYELEYTDILNVNGKFGNIYIQTKNNMISLHHLKNSDEAIKFLQNIINETNNIT